MTGEVDITEDIQELRELPADDRGRVTLGKQYANQSVRLAILKVEDDGMS